MGAVAPPSVHEVSVGLSYDLAFFFDLCTWHGNASARRLVGELLHHLAHGRIVLEEFQARRIVCDLGVFPGLERHRPTACTHAAATRLGDTIVPRRSRSLRLELSKRFLLVC